MRAREAGFTLLEMMVALVVFGLVMAGIAQSFKYGLTAWTASTRNTARPEALAAMNAALAEMIAQSLPGSMTGKPDQFAFTTILPAGAGLNGGLADAAILRTPDGQLILRYTPHPPGVPLAALPAPLTEPLAQNIASLTVAYLTPQPGGTTAWSDNWSGDGLPPLIKIHLQFSDGQVWPDIVAAPINPGN